MAVLFSGDHHQRPELELNAAERLRLLGMVAALTLALTAVLVARGAPGTALHLEVGDVSPRDVVASRAVTYASEVLTERARQSAEAEAGIVYDPSDPGVARRQVSLARQAVDRIGAVRAERQTDAARAEALAGLSDVSLSSGSIARTIGFSDEEWLAVEQEVVRVLDQSMRSVIREADLADARRRVPALVSYELTEDQAGVVVDLVSDLVAANTFPNLDRTAETRRQARDSVEPMTTSFQAGQVIARTGDRITELQLEALQQTGVTAPVRDWRQDAAALASLGLSLLLVYLYIVIREPELGRDWRRLGVLGGLAVLFAAGARLLVPEHVLLPYVYPAAALPMLVAVLISPELALIVALLPGVFYVHLAGGHLLELSAYGVVGGLAGVLLLSRLRHLKDFIWAGAVVLAVNVVVLALFRLPEGNPDASGIASLLGAAVVNAGLAGSVSVIGYLVVGSLLGAVTTLQLLELSRPTQTLLRELLLKAPGTYNHSLMVANMAEQAAERIGASALLARVGAYYHDIGKVSRPYFYAENQQDGANVHDRLDPRSSAEIIIGHVQEGRDLARSHGLPQAVAQFITEHHGRTRQDYFHAEAVKRHGAGEVSDEAFRYPGPRPRSKETAILMLADACEAVVRATRPQSVTDLARAVERIVDDRMLEGELDESPLTLHDIAAIKVAFVNVLQGMFHPRIQYPDEALIEQRQRVEVPVGTESGDGHENETGAGTADEQSDAQEESNGGN